MSALDQRQQRPVDKPLARVLALAMLLSTLNALGPDPASAHEVRPGYLEIRSLPDGIVEGRLRQPILADQGMMRGLDLKAVPPQGCRDEGESVYERGRGYLTERFRWQCAEGLTGEVVIDGLRESITDVYATVELEDETLNFLLNATRPSFSPTDSSGSLRPWAYLGVGIEHLFTGVDHMLFVLGLLLLASSLWRLFLEITAFTVAHSLTLGLAAMGFVSVPSWPVEAGIALSIVFLAYELTRPEEGSSIARRHPEVVAFSFGLLHGLGFAGILGDVGLPQDSIVSALFLFNAGVEIGQLVVVAVVGGLLWGLTKKKPKWGETYRTTLLWIVGIGSIYFFLGTLVP
ncbi:MAG: HupE/UreJ family protein [Acidobacteriota bacterium]